jgi:hypothetical protein
MERTCLRTSTMLPSPERASPLVTVARIASLFIVASGSGARVPGPERVTPGRVGGVAILPSSEWSSWRATAIANKVIRAADNASFTSSGAGADDSSSVPKNTTMTRCRPGTIGTGRSSCAASSKARKRRTLGSLDGVKWKPSGTLGWPNASIRALSFWGSLVKFWTRRDLDVKARTATRSAGCGRKTAAVRLGCMPAVASRTRTRSTLCSCASKGAAIHKSAKRHIACTSLQSTQSYSMWLPKNPASLDHRRFRGFRDCGQANRRQRSGPLPA